MQSAATVGCLGRLVREAVRWSPALVRALSLPEPMSSPARRRERAVQGSDSSIGRHFMWHQRSVIPLCVSTGCNHLAELTCAYSRDARRSPGPALLTYQKQRHLGQPQTQIHVLGQLMTWGPGQVWNPAASAALQWEMSADHSRDFSPRISQSL